MKTYYVKGMDCADCAEKVEKGVSKLDRVEAVQVNFATGQMRIEGEIAEQDLRQRVETLGYGLQAGERIAPARPENFWRFLINRSETRLALAGGGLLILSFLLYQLQLLGLTAAGVSTTPILVIQITALAVAGYPIARSGLTNLWINRDFNINLLMTIAAVGAVIIGEITEGATLIFLYAIAEALEGYTTERARDVISGLRELIPARAVRLRDGKEEIIPVEALLVGDHILVDAGERIPIDGVVEAGASEVNQAPVTGESMPVAKQRGEEVFAGTVNGNGSLEIRATQVVEDTTLSRIIRMVAEAQSMRAPTQRFIDRFAHYYTPAVVLIALAVAVLPPLLFGQSFLNVGGERGWLYRALALVVIACPCALVISAPVTILSAITAAAKRGVLIKGGAFLESLWKITTFAFDKTGTLTAGEPEVTFCRSIDCADDQRCDNCDEVLGLAYSLERRSRHPLARAIVNAAEKFDLTGAFPAAEDVQALSGRGLQGRVAGRLASIGSHSYFHQERAHPPVICEWVDQAELRGQTAMLVSADTQVKGVIAVADQVRPDSRAVVRRLTDLGIQTVMLTGDNDSVAQAVGQSVGIKDVRSGLLPEDKLNLVRELQAQYGSVAMVGDGINDTPALAAATVGIALGGAGSVQALETADVVLMADDLNQLPFTIRLARFTRSLMYANIAASLLVKLVFVGLAVTGITSMWLAVLADTGVALLVTLNGLRALRFRG
jgi:Cd2+/Zn2+-exporting ATPase